MGRIPCSDKVGLKKGPWTPEEDKKLIAYVQKHGRGNWSSVHAKAGLLRCGKSCRLRWINYLSPDIKRGNFTMEEEQTIIQLHALLGNKWSIIASHLPRRTDNEIKNYWNANLKKRLIRMGLDPITHKPLKSNTFQVYGGGYDQSNYKSHMAQWENVRIEAEERESMLQVGSGSSHVPQLILGKIPTQICPSSVLSSSSSHKMVYNMYALLLATNHDLQSSVSTLIVPKLPTISTNSGQVTDMESSHNNVMETTSRIQRVNEDYVLNLEDDDDDIVVAIEAFKTTRCENIEELFNGSTSIEGLL